MARHKSQLGIKHFIEQAKQGSFVWMKARTWHDGVFIAFALIMLAISFNILGDYQSLRSPVYGGDFYNHLGGMYHLLQGGSFFEGWEFLGTTPWAPMFYHLMVVLFSKLGGLSPIDAVHLFAVFLVFVKMLVFYVLGNVMFKSKYVGLLMAGLASATSVMKHNPFVYEILFPLMILFLFLYHITQKRKYVLIAGVWYGLIGITHTIGFISVSFFMVIYVIILFRKDIFSNTFFRNITSLVTRRESIDIYFFMLVGIPLAMLYWFWPIFIYHGHTVNALHIYAIPDYAVHIGYFTVAFIKGLFFDFSSWYAGLATIGRYVLIFGTFFANVRHKDFFLILVVAGLVNQFHFLVTSLFLGFQFVPTDFGNFIWHTSSIIGVGLFFAMFASIIRRLPYAVPTLFVIFLIVISTGVYAHYKDLSKEQWGEKGPLHPVFNSIQSTLLEQTSLDDVILAGNENSFMLNALTGRKIVTSRRTHVSPYVDIDQRMMDAAIMFYGNDSKKIKELLKQYSVDYVYWDQRVLVNEFHFNEKGEIADFFDPLSVLYSPEKEEYVKAYGVSYKVAHGYFTPTYDWTYPTYDIIYLLPPQFDVARPWSDTLYSYLNETASFDIGGQAYWKLYKVVLED